MNLKSSISSTESLCKQLYPVVEDAAGGSKLSTVLYHAETGAGRGRATHRTDLQAWRSAAFEYITSGGNI